LRRFDEAGHGVRIRRSEAGAGEVKEERRRRSTARALKDAEQFLLTAR
jgi:hypothetical protein